MNERCVLHDTIVVRRRYGASVQRVYRAWTDAALLERWYVPGDDTWTAKIVEHDLRVGGRKRITFGPPEEDYHEDCVYMDILPDRRICYSMSVSRGDTRLTVSMVTIELTQDGDGCSLRATDQLGILDGEDTAQDRERGWGETLDKLGPVLADA